MGRVPGKHKGNLITGRDCEFGYRCKVFAVRLNRRVQHQRIGPGDSMNSIFHRAHPRHDRTVIKPDNQFHPHADRAASSPHQAHNVGGAISRRHAIDDRHDTARRLKFRLQNQCVAAVPPKNLCIRFNGTQRPMAVLRVSQAAKQNMRPSRTTGSTTNRSSRRVRQARQFGNRRSMRILRFEVPSDACYWKVSEDAISSAREQSCNETCSKCRCRTNKLLPRDIIISETRQKVSHNRCSPYSCIAVRRQIRLIQLVPNSSAWTRRPRNPMDAMIGDLDSNTPRQHSI